MVALGIEAKITLNHVDCHIYITNPVHDIHALGGRGGPSAWPERFAVWEPLGDVQVTA